MKDALESLQREPYNSKEWRYFAEGKNNILFKRNFRTRWFIYRTRKKDLGPEEAALNSPERTEYLLKLLNSDDSEEFLVVQYHEGVLMPLFINRGTTPQEVIAYLFNLYYQHRRHFIDAAVANNIVKLPTGKIITIDPGMVLKRTGSQSSIEYLERGGKEDIDEWFTEDFSEEKKQINAVVQALLYLDYVYPEMAETIELKNKPDIIETFSNAYLNNRFVDITLFGYKPDRHRFIELNPILKEIKLLDEIPDENVRLFFLNGYFSLHHIRAINFLTDFQSFKINEIAKTVAFLNRNQLDMLIFFLYELKADKNKLESVLTHISQIKNLSLDEKIFSTIEKNILYYLVGVYGLNPKETQQLIQTANMLWLKNTRVGNFEYHYLNMLELLLELGVDTASDNLFFHIVSSPLVTLAEIRTIAIRTKNEKLLSAMKGAHSYHTYPEKVAATIEYQPLQMLKKLMCEQLTRYIAQQSSRATWSGFFVNILWLNYRRLQDAEKLLVRANEATTLCELQSLFFAERCIATIPETILSQDKPMAAFI